MTRRLGSAALQGVLVVMFVCSRPVYAGWWDTNWSERLKLTFDNSGQAETLVDVPVLVTLTPARVDYSKTRPLGADIRFIDGTTGAELDYEIESWVNGGTSHVWVKVPAIEGYSKTDHIWLYYDNPAALDDQDPESVWSNGFRAVWHLRETDIDGDPGDIKDSTSFDNDGTTFNMSVTAQQAGQVNGSFDFDGIDDYVDVVDDNSLSFTDNVSDAPFSLSFWVRPNVSSDDYLVSKTFETFGQEQREWAIWVQTGGLVRFLLYDNDALTNFIGKDTATPLPAGWHHVIATYDGSGTPAGIKVYVDGSRDDAAALSGGTYSSMKNTDANVMLGAYFFGAPANLADPLDGQEDEVRIASVERSADWVRAQYLSTTDALITYGSTVAACSAPIPKVYWADSSDDKIRRANLDGSFPEDVLTTGLPQVRDVAVDPVGCKMYWVDVTDDVVRRANLDGTGVETLVTGLMHPRAIALDIPAGKVYWTDRASFKIQRANLDGSAVEDLITALNRPVGLALDLDAGKMYWANDILNKIERANLDGSGIEDVVVGLGSPHGVALDGDASTVYWSDIATDTIESARFDGSNRGVLVSGLDDPGYMALDVAAGQMYWVEDGASDRVRRIDLDGSNLTDLVTGTPTPYGIDLHLPRRPRLSSASDQLFVPAGPPRPAVDITVTDDPLASTVTTANDIRIRIPAGVNMTWDTSVTSVGLSGPAATNLSATVLGYADADKTVVLDVIAEFSPGDEVTISGLAFANFVTSSGRLEIDVDADGTGDGVDDKTLTIGPVLTTTGADSVGVGQLYTLNLSASGSVTSWTIDWGDGTIETIAGNPSSVTHTYTQSGFTFDISASAVFDGATFLQNELLVTSRTGDVKRYESTTGRFLQSIGSAELNSPEDVIVGPDGNIYVTDDQGAGSDNVFRYDPSGSFIDVLVPGRLGLEVPVGMAFGPTEILYVAGWNTDNVVRYDATTGALLGTFVSPGSGGLDEANYVLFGPDGHLYVSSTRSDAILRYDGASGSFMGSFVAAGSGGLDGPEGFAWGHDGQLYVASGQTNQVLRYNGTTGVFIDVFVTAGSGGLAFPVAVDFGSDGRLYVSSSGSDEVLRYDETTGAPIDAYVAAAAGSLDAPYYVSFVPGHRVAVTAAGPGPTISSASNQSFEADDPPTPAATVTVTDHVSVPRVAAANDLRIRIPPGFNMTWDTTVSTVTLGGAASSKVATTLLGYEDGDRTAVIDVVTDFLAGEDVTISGLRFTDFTAVSVADYMTLEVDNDDVTTATDDKLITITANNAPRLSSATNQVFVVGAPSTSVATITITESAFTGWITKKKELRVRIPAGFNTTWDPGITTITVGGSGSGNVDTTLRAYEDGNKTAVIDVDQDFAPGEQVTIDGLQFQTFTTVSAADNLELEVFDDGGVTATDDKTIEIIADVVARIVSERDQLFWENDPPTPAEAIFITDASVASITATNDLRIRIPPSLAMAWDGTVTSVGVTGTGAAKVGTAVSYEDANKTLVLDVTTDFASADYIRVSGTMFTGFFESPTGYLELEVANDDLVTSADANSITIDPVSKVRVFTAKSTSGENRLEWLNPRSGPYVSTRIVAKDGSPPANPFDGRLVVDQAGGLGATDWHVDSGLVDGITVHYAAYVDQGGASFSEVARTTGRPFDHLSGSVRWAFSTGATTMVPPSIRFLAGVPTVYVVSNTDVFYAMDGGTGGGSWPAGWKPVEFGAPSQSRPPVVPFGIGSASNGAALVGSQDGSVYVIDADTGETVWKSTIAEGVQAAPAGEFTAYATGDTDLVLVGTRNTLAPNAVNALFALNVGDGLPAWNFRNLSSQGGDDLRMGIVNGGASIDYLNNRVYFASRQGSAGVPGPSPNTLWCISFDGVAPTLEWAKNIGDVDGSPVLYNGTIYVGTVAGDVYAFDTAGTELWSNTTLADGPVKGFVFPIFGTSDVMLSTSTKVWSLDVNGVPNTGWPVTLPSPSTPVYSWGLGTVFVGGGDSKLYQIDIGNPASVSSATLGDGVAAAAGAPTLDRKSSLVYIGTDRGVVYAVEFPIP